MEMTIDSTNKPTFSEEQNMVETLVREHYDAFPFDFFSPMDVYKNVIKIKLIERFFKRFIRRGDLVIDVGCGIGRHGYMIAKCSQRQPIMIDLSFESIKETSINYGLPSLQASNLALPILDKTADNIVSNGVIHHTADPKHSFSELMRILKVGGYLYLSCYQKGSIYYYLYKFFQVANSLLNKWNKMYVFKRFIFQMIILFYIWLPRILRDKRWEYRTDQKTWNFFADQFLNPQVLFFTRELLECYCYEFGAKILMSRNESGNQMLSMIIRKMQ